MRKYSIDPTSIGRLEVGTETLLDKSKSVKSVLMQLFEPSGNTNIEGVDTINACYGGTNALFNSVSWVESSAWDGRDAIVVAGDIALYKQGNARPTGGAGCVAMLVGPDAPLVLEPQRGTYMIHAYDFYKPDLTSEYPIVDGQFSLRSYSQALDACYKHYSRRHKLKHSQSNGSAVVNGDAAHGAGEAETETPLDLFDYMGFHSPTCKTVAKSYARLLYNDYLVNPTNPIFSSVPPECRSVEYAASLTDKTIEKTFGALAKKRFAARVQPAIEVPTMCGNMYCASVFSSLCSIITNVNADDLAGKRIALFSYGSGLASSMYSFRVKGSTEKMAKELDIHMRLDARKVVAPQVYNEVCTMFDTTQDGTTLLIPVYRRATCARKRICKRATNLPAIRVRSLMERTTLLRSTTCSGEAMLSSNEISFSLCSLSSLSSSASYSPIKVQCSQMQRARVRYR